MASDSGSHYCPECKSKNIVYDSERGETVCKDCGLVLSTFHLESKKSTKKPSIWNYLDIKVTKGGKLSSRERTELAVAGKIELIGNKLSLAPALKYTAVVNGKKLLKYLRETHCVRLTCEEVAVISIWMATREEPFPLSMRELAEAAGWEKNTVYPLLNRISKYFPLPKKKPALESYVLRVISKVQRQARKYQIPESYMLDLERASVQVLREIKATPKVAREVIRRSPILVAVAIVHVADENMGGRLTSKKMHTNERKETLLNHLGGGGPSVTSIAKFLRNNLPNQPKILAKKKQERS
jgi:transcription initiation factor TFIIIB Brf1 subunit/transcription initiation factor TFIIB